MQPHLAELPAERREGNDLTLAAQPPQAWRSWPPGTVSRRPIFLWCEHYNRRTLVPLAAGSCLGSYEILAPIGAGGMGEVYRARDTKLAREVAIKVLPEDVAAHATALARFEREARAIAALSHPNILAIHDFGTSDGVIYAVMELLHGETLRQRLDHGAIPARRATEIAREIALGLAAAHERGVVHRDLKPENLFLTKDGLVKILDFGLARQIPDQRSEVSRTLSDHTTPGTILGTNGYMSPEQVRGEPADHRSDIFSFGAVLYEMLAGRRAFQGGTVVETLNAILREEPEPPGGSRPLPPGLERTVLHCLEKKPEDRFQSARDLAFDLGALSGSASTPSAIPTATRSGRTFRRAGMAGAAIALAALLVWAGRRTVGGQPSASEPTFRRLTFRRGNIVSARFTPDGRTVVYSASWEGKPAELLTVRTDSLESQPLGVVQAAVASVSSKGELALLLLRDGEPTLARLPLGASNPRELLENVLAASWAPAGEDLAVLHRSGDISLEYPIGHRLYRSAFLDSKVRVSPDGKLVAVAESRQNKPPQTVAIFDQSGARRTLATVDILDGFAWSPTTGELLFIGGDENEAALRAVDAAGHARIVMPLLGRSLYLHDVSSDGRLLLERSSTRTELRWRSVKEPRDRSLSWLDGSDLRALSDDGQTVLFGEIGDGRRSQGSGVYMRRSDGSPAVRLGDGVAQCFSSDGKSAFALAGDPFEIIRLPIGPGSPRKVTVTGIEPLDVFTLPGDRIALLYLDDEGRSAWAIAGQDGGPPIRLNTPEIKVTAGAASSPDGQLGVYANAEGKMFVLPLTGGPSRPLPGPPLQEGELIQQWSADGRSLFIARFEGLTVRVTRRDIATGHSEPLLLAQPDDTTGVTRLLNFQLSRSGESYAYSQERVEVSDLFVVDGLK